MRRSTRVALGLVVSLALIPLSASAQIGPMFGVDPFAEYGLSISGGPSVVGSDGTIYVATSSLSWSLSSIFSSTSSSSGKLRAIKPKESPGDDKTLNFTGYATLLALGADSKGDLLYLVAGKTIYLIPANFDVTLGPLEQIAEDITDAPALAPVPLAAATKITLDGYAISLKVSPDKKNFYVNLSKTTTEKTSSGRTTYKFSLSTLVFDAAGKKVKEVKLD